jgi:HEPN superfamily protein
MDGQIDRGGTRSEPVPAALRLIQSARQRLAAGEHDTSPVGRYIAAHLAALRAAAALVAARPEGGILRRRKRPRNVWEQLPKAEPALSQWAAHFAAVAGTRGAVVSRRTRAVSRRQANRLLSDAEAFVSLAEDALGVTAEPQHVRYHPSAASLSPGRRSRGRSDLSETHNYATDN